MSKIKGTKLPREINPAIHNDITRAYAICLRCEEELERELEAGRDATRELVDCRVVGYLLHHPPTNEALETVVNEVLSCANHGDLLKLGRIYFDYLLKPFYQYVEDYYITFDCRAVSPPPFSPLNSTARKMANQTPRDSDTAHHKALVRDKFTCMLSGAHDHSCMSQSKELRRIWPVKALDWGFTVCVYIMREIHGGSGSDEEKKDIPNVHAILRRFGYENLLAELSGIGFHRLENVLTITCDIRDIYDQMLVWFSETAEPHTYEVRMGAFLRENWLPIRETYGLPEYVTFTTPDEAKLPLPSPTYLRLHASVCEIGDLSGATNYMRNFHDESGIVAKDPKEVEYVF